jgi:glycosyltransferase involved in cell wall biosynthesis
MLRILFLGDNLANAQQWKNAMRKSGQVEIMEWGLDSSNKYERILLWLLVVIFGKWFFKKFKADMVIGYRTTSYGFLAAFSGVKVKVIAAQGESDIWPTTGWQVHLKTFIRNYACKKANLIHAWGEHMKDSILTSGINPNKILVCPRGIDINLFNFVSYTSKESNTPIFISTRSLFPEYQFDLIVEAFCLLHNAGFNFKYYIIGDGSEFNILKNKIIDAKLESKILLLGKINNSELPDYLGKSHFYVSLPITEGVSASLFEAMACGCFPIVSNLPANKLFITNNRNGILVENFSPETLYLQLKRVINERGWIDEAVIENRKLVEQKADLNKNISMFICTYQKLLTTSK